MMNRNQNKMPEPEPEDVLFGIRAVMEAIKAGRSIDKVLMKKGLSGDLSYELMDLVKEFKVPYQIVPIENINHVTRKNHQGVIAFVASAAFYDLEEIVTQLFAQKKNPFLLVLDKVTDVRNFGAIVRTAECAGVDAVIIPDKGSARIGSDAFKTSAGALEFVKICRVPSLLKALQYLKASGIQLVAATEKTQSLYYSADFKGPVALMAGSEDRGIAKEFIALSEQQVKIPVMGKIESLNVSVAAAILIYEVVKQRNELN